MIGNREVDSVVMEGVSGKRGKQSGGKGKQK